MKLETDINDVLIMAVIDLMKVIEENEFYVDRHKIIEILDSAADHICKNAGVNNE
jgi:hypothetical protein